MKNSSIKCFQRYVIYDLERAQTSKHCIIENQLCLSETTFVGYAKNGHLVSLWDLIKKGLSVITVGQYAQDRMGERRQFCPLLFQWQGHLMVKIKKSFEWKKKVVNIVPDKLKSTLGLRLPPIFTLLPCLASRPGLLPGGQGSRVSLKAPLVMLKILPPIFLFHLVHSFWFFFWKMFRPFFLRRITFWP